MYSRTYSIVLYASLHSTILVVRTREQIRETIYNDDLTDPIATCARSAGSNDEGERIKKNPKNPSSNPQVATHYIT